MLVQGKKLVTVRHGRCADFCVVCRAVQWCEARELQWVPHICLAPTGPGELFVAEFVCEKCGVSYAAPLDFVRIAKRVWSEDMMEVAAQTSLLGAAGLARRVDLEDRARARRIGAAERAELVREPLMMLAHQAAKMQTRGRGESWMVSLGVGGALAGAVGIVGWFELSQPGKSASWAAWVAGIASVLAAGALIGCAWMMMHQRRLAAEWYALPYLARSLVQLRPTRAEIEGAIRESAGSASLEGLEAEDVVRGVERAG